MSTVVPRHFLKPHKDTEVMVCVRKRLDPPNKSDVAEISVAVATFNGEDAMTNAKLFMRMKNGKKGAQ